MAQVALFLRSAARLTFEASLPQARCRAVDMVIDCLNRGLDPLGAKDAVITGRGIAYGEQFEGEPPWIHRLAELVLTSCRPACVFQKPEPLFQKSRESIVNDPRPVGEFRGRRRKETASGKDRSLDI
jgi:hypothetical protein